MSSRSSGPSRLPKYQGFVSRRSSQQRNPSGTSDDQSASDARISEQDTHKSKDPFMSGGRLTLYGRKPVYEALSDPRITPQRLFVSRQARGELIHEIMRLAERVGLPVQWMSDIELSRISKNGRQDQGVALDLQALRHGSLKDLIDEGIQITGPLILIDGVNTPANLGMIIRGAWAAGVQAIILPDEGCAPLNPLALKASAGVAIHAAIWRCTRAAEAVQSLVQLGVPVFGLAGEAERSLYDETWPQVSAWVVGNETEGMSQEVRALLTRSIRMPMSGGVESLNAAVAVSVVAFELARQRGQDA